MQDERKVANRDRGYDPLREMIPLNFEVSISLHGIGPDKGAIELRPIPRLTALCLLEPAEFYAS